MYSQLIMYLLDSIIWQHISLEHNLGVIQTGISKSIQHAGIKEVCAPTTTLPHVTVISVTTHVSGLTFTAL